MILALSEKRFARRLQRRAIRKVLVKFPDDVKALLWKLPIRVEFTRAPGKDDSVCAYMHDLRAVYIPRSFYQDWAAMAGWIRKDKKGTIGHEFMHAIDFNLLTTEQRDEQLKIITGYEANFHKEWAGVKFPFHNTQTERKAAWFYNAWEFNAGEVWADAALMAFTNLPPQSRNPEPGAALPITPAAIEGARNVITEIIAKG